MMEGLNIQTLDLGRKGTQVADCDLEGAGLRLTVRILPDLQSPATLQVQGDAGVPFLGLATRIGQHPFCHRIIFQDPDVKAEMLDEPIPGFPEINGTHAYLLDAGNVE